MSKLTEEIVLYCREHYIPNDPEFGIAALAKKFNVSRDAIKDATHGRSYKNFGGKIHPTIGHTPDEVKAAVLAEYTPRSSDANVQTLAKKYGLSATTVLKILHDNGDRPKGKRAVVTDELRQQVYELYQPHSREFGRTGLAEKFGLSSSTIGNILKEFPKKEKAEEVKEPSQRRKRAELLDEIKEAIIIAHDEEKLSVRALAERFSLAREVVKEVLVEAGIEIRQRQIIDDETKQKVIKMYATGNYSVRELAEKFSINRATLTQWVKGMTPPQKQAKPTEVDDATREQILRFYSHGHGVAPIAKTLNLPQSIVRKIVNGEM